MLGQFRTLLSSSNRVPSAVLSELVDTIFTMQLPVAFMGVTVASVGALIAAKEGDIVIWVLSATAILITGGRVLLMRAYHRRASAAQHTQEAKIWERRYALGSHAFAVLLAIFNVRALMINDPLIAMLITALTFGYAAGLVTRVSVRPAICMTSLGLTVVPTVIAFAVQIIGAPDYYTMAMFAAQALVTAGFAGTSLESVTHIYRTTLQQLLAKQDLAILAGQDILTGLPNRTLLRARLNESIVQLRQNNTVLAYHCLDLDRFKAVNDTFGHPIGDALLKVVAERLTGILRVNDTAARVGGDEFVILQIGISSEDEARLLALRIIRALSAPYTINDHDLRIGASIGIALAPRDGITLDRLAARGDAALYEAKHRGRGRVVVAGETLPPPAAITAA